MRGAELVARTAQADAFRAFCTVSDTKYIAGIGSPVAQVRSSLSDAVLAVLDGNRPWVVALCMLSPSVLACGTCAPFIKLWDVPAGACLRTIPTYSDVMSLCMASATLLASGLRDGTWALWDWASGRRVATMRGHPGPVGAVCMASPGLLATGCAAGSVRLWAVPDVAPDAVAAAARAPCVRLLWKHTACVSSLCAVSASLLASASWDGAVLVWSVDTGDCVRQLRAASSDRVHAMCVASSRTLIAAHEAVLSAWDVLSGALLWSHAATGAAKPVAALSMVSSTQFVSGTFDGELARWDARALIGAGDEFADVGWLPLAMTGWRTRAGSAVRVVCAGVRLSQERRVRHGTALRAGLATVPMRPWRLIIAYLDG